MVAGLRQVAQVFGAALRLGLTSFGGPLAHIAYFRRDYVERRRWLDEATFAELAALSQVLPGPSSSQLGMAIGHLQAGRWGALAAWLGFTLPSAAAMVILAFLWGQWPRSDLTVVTHGLLLVATAVIGQAALGMYRAHCRPPLAASAAWLSLAALLVVPHPLTLAVLLALGAGLGLGWLSPVSAKSGATTAVSAGRRWGAGCLVTFVLLAIGLPSLSHLTSWEPLAWADGFYRTGSWVFGGGHVVLPWLQREVVSPGWVTSDAFWAAYGAAQALPGPLFAVAGFFGTVVGGVPGAIIALVAIFLPGLLLMQGVLPFWAQVRGRRLWKGAVAGISATMVGLLASALVTAWTTAVRHPADALVVAILLVLLEVARWPSWAVVLAGVVVSPWVLLLAWHL